MIDVRSSFSPVKISPISVQIKRKKTLFPEKQHFSAKKCGVKFLETDLEKTAQSMKTAPCVALSRFFGNFKINGLYILISRVILKQWKALF